MKEDSNPSNVLYSNQITSTQCNTIEEVCIGRQEQYDKLTSTDLQPIEVVL